MQKQAISSTVVSLILLSILLVVLLGAYLMSPELQKTITRMLSPDTALGENATRDKSLNTLGRLVVACTNDGSLQTDQFYYCGEEKFNFNLNAIDFDQFKKDHSDLKLLVPFTRSKCFQAAYVKSLSGVMLAECDADIQKNYAKILADQKP